MMRAIVVANEGLAKTCQGTWPSVMSSIRTQVSKPGGFRPFSQRAYVYRVTPMRVAAASMERPWCLRHDLSMRPGACPEVRLPRIMARWLRWVPSDVKQGFIVVSCGT